eukprot:359787-Chlamydomonas_euryale.AAC.12
MPPTGQVCRHPSVRGRQLHVGVAHCPLPPPFRFPVGLSASQRVWSAPPSGCGTTPAKCPATTTGWKCGTALGGRSPVPQSTRQRALTAAGLFRSRQQRRLRAVGSTQSTRQGAGVSGLPYAGVR